MESAAMRMTIALFLAICAVSASAQQVDPGLRDLMQARNHGAGGAYRALGLGTEAINGNPAAMSLFQRYQMELTGAWEIQGRITYAGFAILDSMSGALAGGVSYHFGTLGTGSDARTFHYSTIGLGMPLAPWLHIGVSGHHLLMGGAAQANSLTMDAGALVRIADAFHLGFSAHNLIDTGHRELSRYFVLAAGFVSGRLSVGADLRGDFGVLPARAPEGAVAGAAPVLALSTGAEYVFGIVPARAGYSVDALTGRQYLSAGLGVMTETGNLDIAYRHELYGTAKLISLTVRLGQ
jgi:hypothetical protein